MDDWKIMQKQLLNYLENKTNDYFYKLPQKEIKFDWNEEKNIWNDHDPKHLWDISNNNWYTPQIDYKKKFNDLLAFLKFKQIIINENELKEFIESIKLADKLSEK